MGPGSQVVSLQWQTGFGLVVCQAFAASLLHIFWLNFQLAHIGETFPCLCCDNLVQVRDGDLAVLRVLLDVSSDALEDIFHAWQDKGPWGTWA